MTRLRWSFHGLVVDVESLGEVLNEELPPEKRPVDDDPSGDDGFSVSRRVVRCVTCVLAGVVGTGGEYASVGIGCARRA